MNLLYSVAFEQNVFVYIFLTLTFCFDAMAPLAWWSVAEAKLITNSTKNIHLSQFVHMLHNRTDSSNSEVIIMFPGQFAIDPLVHDEDLSYKIF